MTDVPTWADDPVITPVVTPTWADPPADKYRAAAETEYAKVNQGGLLGGTRTPTGYTARAAKPFGMGWGDDVMAGGMVPFEMVKRGTLDPVEAYRYTRARETLNQEKLAENTKGVMGGLAEGVGIAGSVGNFVGSGTRAAAAAIPGTVSAKIPASVMNAASNVGRGAAYGAIQGSGDAPTASEMGQGAIVGGALGGVLGGTLPMAFKSLTAAAGAAQLPRLRDPAKIAVEEIAETARRAGVKPDDIIPQLQAARAAGQPLTIADALQHEGQRKLAALAKVPGEQRERIVDFMSKRDLAMPERTGTQIGRSMGAPNSAAQESEALIGRATQTSAPLYREAERHPAWNETIQRIVDDPISRTGLAHGVELQRLRSLGTDRPFNPRDAMITGFNEAGDPIISGVPNMQTLHTLKVGLDRMVEAEINPNTHRLTARGSAIDGVRRRLLEQIDAENPAYAAARSAYAGPMQVNTAVQLGQQWPTRGRSVDNVAAFEAMNPPAQQGVRIGVADALQSQLEKTGDLPKYLRAKSLKGQNEIEALAPYGPNSLKEFLAREELMQKGSRGALGGSATAENAADIASTPAAASVFNIGKDAVTGNWLGAAKGLAERVGGLAKGENADQRLAITKALLERDPAQAQKLVDALKDYELRRRGVNPFVARPPRYPDGQ